MQTNHIQKRHNSEALADVSAHGDPAWSAAAVPSLPALPPPSPPPPRSPPAAPDPAEDRRGRAADADHDKVEEPETWRRLRFQIPPKSNNSGGRSRRFG